MSNLAATPRPRMLHFTPSLNHISHHQADSPTVRLSHTGLLLSTKSTHIPIMNSFLASNQQLPVPRVPSGHGSSREKKGGTSASFLHIFPIRKSFK